MNALADRFNALICTLEPGPADGLGPLRGVSVMVKDNIDVQGVATTNGLPGVWPVAERDAAVVTQLRRAGAVIAGKTNLSELALGATSCNRTFGDCRNPRAPDRVPGGSSGGAAAAVAAGLCDLAIGSDTGGSIRNPASLCGVVGLRPSPGRISTCGLTPLSRRHDTIGLIARDADLLARAFSVLAAAEPAPVELAGVRVGIPDEYFFDALDPSVGAGIEAAIARLERRRLRVGSVRLHGAKGTQEALGVLIAREAGLLHRALLAQEGLLDPYVRERLAAGLAASAATVRRAERVRASWRRTVLDAFRALNLIVTPTVPIPPPPLGADPLSATSALNRLTAPWSLAAAPALSLPCGVDDVGLPIGLQLVAAPGQDELLLAVAHAIQGGPT